MSPLHSLDRFFREVDLVLQQLAHLNICFSQVCRALALAVRVADLGHEEVGAVVARHVLIVQERHLGVARRVLVFRASAIEGWDGQLL